ncbi:hypothetical protein JCM8547_000245 [Rhodosporidiobolus lusitaniae]
MPPTLSLSSSSPSTSVDLLILGAGWTSTFLIPHLLSSHPSLSFAATTRDGRKVGGVETIEWAWDGEKEGSEQFEGLPRARTVLVVFPIRGEEGSRRLVRGYEESVGGRVRWIQLGSTGIFDGGPTLAADPNARLSWTNRHSPYDTTNARAIAEDELLSMHEETFVLNLSGLWGGTRNPSNWIPRIAPTLEALETKGSLHLVHGEDVARAVVAVHLSPSRSSSSPSSPDAKEKPLKGTRWVLTDLRVYDWWDLVSAHPSPLPPSPDSPSPSFHTHAGEHTPPHALWVQHLMRKHGVRSLPRTQEELGRAIDSREFWEEFGLMPSKGRWEEGRA